MKRNSGKRYKLILFLLVVLGMIGSGFGGILMLQQRIPDQVQVSVEGDMPELFREEFESIITCKKEKATESCKDYQNEASTVSAASTITTLENIPAADYKIRYELFGKIPLKTVSVSVKPRQKVYPGGTPIGIYLETEGVYVVGTGEITMSDGSECCPAEHIVQTGDYIKNVNGTSVNTKEELIECISECQGEDVLLDVNRDSEMIQLKLRPVLDQEGTYRIGIWVRNDTQGIGTLTYIDEKGNFGALGHGISDIDTGELLNIQEGILYDADVVSIIKGTHGTPGELAGVIHYSSGYQMGKIRENRKNGLYGTVVSLPSLVEDSELLDIAYRQEVKEGAAMIRSAVDGSTRDYKVDIKEIRLNGKDVNKGMILEVTDETLLELTGGIVQGMSGSPIIQDGKLIGAVTHVLVNDPTRGYGIFIENMLE